MKDFVSLKNGQAPKICPPCFERINNMNKLEVLAESYGMTVEEMCEQATFDSLAPSICMNPGCDYTTDMEPDQSEGWCEECGTGSVKSVLCLMGIL